MGLDHTELGSLHFEEDSGGPVMILGSRELKGKVEELKEQFCVFEKTPGKANGMSVKNNILDV